MNSGPNKNLIRSTTFKTLVSCCPSGLGFLGRKGDTKSDWTERKPKWKSKTLRYLPVESDRTEDWILERERKREKTEKVEFLSSIFFPEPSRVFISLFGKFLPSDDVYREGSCPLGRVYVGATFDEAGTFTPSSVLVWFGANFTFIKPLSTLELDPKEIGR